MATKLIVFALCVVSALAAPQAAKYPAGVDPHTCPNYPNCDNVALAAHATGAPYAAPAYSAYGHAAGVPGAAAAYPAGVDPHACPNYPYCGPTPAHVPGAAPHNSWAAPAAHNNWAAPAAHNNWAAPAAHNNWAAPAAHNNWAAPAAHNNWAAPAAHNAWAAPAPAAAAVYPAGVSPHSCPNYPYCS
ncbi:hypothetical protein J437_LFUL011009 [Ladona fulva]|uniref:Cuticle protein CPCFC domain-containing protein n=1 Tax=Ladona fulva TaxID=123851 RepID=A0A8K0P724_LADFU|nr:hypothetical protein J437_LFUL011009 [Ladona fulva]